MCDNGNISTVQNYPELFAKVHKSSAVGCVPAPPSGKPLPSETGQRAFKSNYARNKELQKLLLDRNVTPSCTVGYIRGKCETGHRFLKSIYCGKEWCKNCGLDGSPVHQRRIARWYPKVITFRSLGYFVITIPEAIREEYNNRERLSSFRNYCKRKLQRLGFDKGLSRWHIFGECHRCSGDGCDTCNNTGAGTKYNPHLNIFVNKDFIHPSIIKTLRDDLTRYFKNHFRNVPEAKLKGNVFYQYTMEAPLIIHRLKYVTRSTFRIIDNRTLQYQKTWKGYRITSTWGKFTKPKKESTSELVTLENGCCSRCKHDDGLISKINWSAGNYYPDFETGQLKYKRELVSVRDVRESEVKLQHIEAGYYYIIDS